METTKATQEERVLDYIREFGSITQLQALRDLCVMRLASRVSSLRKQGYPIIGEVVIVKNRYGEECRIKRYSFYDSGRDGETGGALFG